VLVKGFKPFAHIARGHLRGALAQGVTRVARPWRGRGLVPQEHLTDLGTAVARSRFKVGQPVAARVLAADAAARRITLTLKKALVGGKLPPFTSWEVCAGGMGGQACSNTVGAIRIGTTRSAHQRGVFCRAGHIVPGVTAGSVTL
jgi:hypothetical protein